MKILASKDNGDKNETNEPLDEVVSLDMSADRKLVVTGQSGKTPSVRVCNAETGKLISTFKLADGSRGVAAVAISPCLRYIACADLHTDHRVIIHNIKRNKTLLTIDGGKDKIVNIAWS